MCGIAGVIEEGSTRSEGGLRQLVGEMADRLWRRGPDDRGQWADASFGVGLGFRRLSILDLSVEGHQPMSSASGRYVLVFNGEVYNHQSLREELQAQGAAPAFRGHSDTEVMLAAIEAWGIEGAVKRFVGMFAFALWDQEEKRLTLVRDRLGIKPLYYGWSGRAFLFGSELKALRAYPGFEAEIDREALALYLRHGYIPAPQSIYRGIRKLEPGSLLTLEWRDQRRKEPVTRSYWSALEVVERGKREPFRGSEAEAIEELEARLKEAVKLRMIADVPLGAFLSGGIDSSTVVALMQSQSRRPVKTFSIGFYEEAYNEATHARRVAEALGTEHTELYVTAEEAMGVIPKLPELYDEPFADSSQVPTYLVCELARKEVTVALSGDGGDELFAGYNRYVWCPRLWQRIRPVPLPVRRLAGSLGTRISPATWDSIYGAGSRLLPARRRPRLPGDKINKVLRLMGESSPEAVYASVSAMWAQPGKVLSPHTGCNSTGSFADSVGLNTLGSSNVSYTERMMARDLVEYLPDDILVKVDRASMGVSLEARVPVLDHRVVEFAWRLPLSLKIRGGESKWILRQVLARHLPLAMVDRAKMGFDLPVGSWLAGPLREWCESLLDRAALEEHGLFDTGVVEQIWQEHRTGRRGWHDQIWPLLMFQAWRQHSRSTVPV